MRPRRLRRLLGCAFLGAILAGATIGTGIAKASPSVCGSLAVAPTVGTVEQLVVEYVADGWTARQAGELIGRAVFAGCPEYVPVLQAFVDAYAPHAGTQRA